MNKYTAENLKNILENHTKWLNDGDGTRADLSGADLRMADLRMADLRVASLSGADLSGADLSGADLSGADLWRANLRGAKLSGADLSGANLWRANLRGADLSGADLRMADLRMADLRVASLGGADLWRANLRGADLSGAKLPDPEIMNSICPMICPEKGAFIGWKKAKVVFTDESEFERNVEVIIELQIPARAKRSSATSRKCRCNEAAVLDIQSLDGESFPKGMIAHSRFMYSFTYEVGQKLYVDNFDDNRWNECSTGIHFFITRQEAVDYL